MYHTILEFTSEWKAETEATGKLMDALTDESLQQAITPHHRTLGQIAWHIVWVMGSVSKAGFLEFEKPDGEERAPASALKIASEYKKTARALLQAVETQWTDATLQIKQDVHGEEWSNAKSMHLLVQHEVHHRGQMTVLMRQAGLRPVGVYGPTRDDWMEKGQEPYL